MRHALPTLPASLLALVPALALAPAPARATNFVELYVQGHGGYADGTGEEDTTALAGNPAGSRKDFYKLVHGAGVGAEIGVKLFAIDVYGTFLQFMDGSQTTGTLSRLILGTRFGFGDDLQLSFRLGAGGMLGTYGDTDPRTAETGETPYGFTARGGLMLGYRFLHVFTIGPQLDVGWYYLLNGTVQPDDDVIAEIQAQCGADQTCIANAVAAREDGAGVGFETSSGVDWTALFALRATLGF